MKTCHSCGAVTGYFMVVIVDPVGRNRETRFYCYAQLCQAELLAMTDAYYGTGP